MSKGRNQAEVSFWFWFGAIFVMMLPCIGQVMILVWAFTGTNRSKQNFFRAQLAWALLALLLMAVSVGLGFKPLLEEKVRGMLYGQEGALPRAKR